MMAALLDVDGTLVDSTYAHVHAWGKALDQTGHPVEHARIHRTIGMGTEQLLAELVGDTVAQTIQEDATRRHDDCFTELAGGLRPLPGARELINGLHDRGWRVVLASSAKPEELDTLLGVLALDHGVDAATSSGDVDSAKPAPDLIQVALDKAGAGPDEAIMVGDAEWDMQAAKRAQVLGVGVLTGGVPQSALYAAGAALVYPGPRDLYRQVSTLERRIYQRATAP